MNAQAVFGWIIFALGMVAGVKMFYDVYQTERSWWTAVRDFPLGVTFVYVMVGAIVVFLWVWSFAFEGKYYFVPGWVAEAIIIPIRSIFEWVVVWWMSN